MQGGGGHKPLHSRRWPDFLPPLFVLPFPPSCSLQKTTKLVFLPAIGSDPTQPRKIPGLFSFRPHSKLRCPRLIRAFRSTLFLLPDTPALGGASFPSQQRYAEAVMCCPAWTAAPLTISFSCFSPLVLHPPHLPPPSRNSFPFCTQTTPPFAPQNRTRCTRALTRARAATSSSTSRTAGIALIAGNLSRAAMSDPDATTCVNRPMHNDCDGGSYMDEDYNRAGFY